MLKLILLGPFCIDDEQPSNFDDPRMICHYERVLSMWMWHPRVMNWFRDQIGYPVYFKTHFDMGMWTLESHGWRDETDTTLFLLTYTDIVSKFKVEEMTKLDEALLAYEAVINAKPDDRDERYRALLHILSTFEMRPEPIDYENLPSSRPSFQTLKGRSPNTVMLSILGDLSRREIMPPTVEGTPSITERFVYGILAKIGQ